MRSVHPGPPDDPAGPEPEPEQTEPEPTAAARPPTGIEPSAHATTPRAGAGNERIGDALTPGALDRADPIANAGDRAGMESRATDLTAGELRVLAAAARGAIADLADLEDAAREVRARVLRVVLGEDPRAWLGDGIARALESGHAASGNADRHGPEPRAAGYRDDTRGPPRQAEIAGWRSGLERLRGPLRIRGGAVRGAFRPPAVTPAVTSGRASLIFEGTTFDAPFDLSGGEFLAVRLIDCELPAFIGASLQVRADLDLSGSRLGGIVDHSSELGDVGSCSIYLNGARIGGRLQLGMHGPRRFEARRSVRLERARIEGDLVLEGARLDGCGDQALDARGSTIGGRVNLDAALGASFEARGEVSFSGAAIQGDLTLRGALLQNPGGRALHCEDLAVESALMTSQGDVPFRALGRVNFLSARVGGNLILSDARLSPGPDYPGRIARDGPVAVNLQQVDVSNALIVSNVGALDPAHLEVSASAPPRPVHAWFLLSACRARSILDAEDGWPAAGFLDLDGLSYERLSDGGGSASERRIRWLRLQYPGGRPTAATFRPQPFEALAGVLRRQGRAEEADDVAVEKIRVRLAARVDDPFTRIVPRLLMWVSRHGHSSGRALLSFVLFIALGSGFYATALWGFDQPFVPVEHDPVPTVYRSPFGPYETRHEKGCPALEIPFFALDAALPLVDVGQVSACRFAPEGPARGVWFLLHSLYTVLGAVLTAVVVLTLSGLLRR